jgi:predicted Fe-Mo cluster-binding NifX family protein
MRIAIVLDQDHSIAGHFGKSAGFLIFDIAEKNATEIEFRPNTAKSDHEQGKCHSHNESHHPNHDHFVAALKDCDSLICRGIGRRAIADLSAHGIKPFIIADDIAASQAAELFALGRLIEVKDSQCCSH